MRRPWSEILIDALERFDGGKKWMRGRLFDDYRSDSFVESVEKAEKFCAYGAIYKSMVEHGELMANPFVVGREGDHSILLVVERLLGKEGQFTVTDINDTAPNFNTVKDMFCTGIKRALDEEQQAKSITTKEQTDENNS